MFAIGNGACGGSRGNNTIGAGAVIDASVINVEKMPRYAFGHRSVLWWATLGLFAIEGTMFALVVTSYLYIKGRNPHWGPGVFPPDLFWGTLNTIVLLVSCVPNQFAKQASEKLDVRRVQLWLSVCVVFGVTFNVIRIFEFRHLNVWWDTNAYGSVVWTLLGFHTVHILTDLFDTIVLAAIMFLGPLEEKRFVDVSENAFYWYFVVLTWLPIYGLIYFAPRVA
jgi:heme/copper-type cytochrome/quinol oxidase subunit 3